MRVLLVQPVPGVQSALSAQVQLATRVLRSPQAVLMQLHVQATRMRPA
ncbi:hypothetical protein [Xanthomonas cannabis]|nr:hypothetical protein [Xanthomonas cannabis]NIK19205.1 hypothetical protein [Xanthomonas cannabis]